jgi:hypothetical protein
MPPVPRPLGGFTTIEADDPRHRTNAGRFEHRAMLLEEIPAISGRAPRLGEYDAQL